MVIDSASRVVEVLIFRVIGANILDKDSRSEKQNQRYNIVFESRQTPKKGKKEIKGELQI